MSELSSASGRSRSACPASARIAAVGCVLAAAAFAASGCTNSPHGQGGGGDSSHQAGGGSLSAARAVALATHAAQRVSSLTLTENVTLNGLPMGAVSGLPAGSAIKMTIHAKTVLRPAVLAAVTMNMNMAGRAVTIDEILTSKALYLKAPTMALTHSGKPWEEISLASLPNGADLHKLFAKAEMSGPAGHLGSPRGLAKLLGGARHVRVVRNQVVDGVRTTEYSGVLSLGRIRALLAPSERRMFGSAVAGLRLNGPFRVWIDGHHQARMVDLRFNFRKITMSVHVNITSINKPVRIVPPPASQVAPISSP